MCKLYLNVLLLIEQIKRLSDLNTQRFISLLIAFFFPIVLLFPVQTKVAPPMLLVERFVVGGGWWEIAFLSIYSLVLTYIMIHTKNIAKWRKRYWLLFSIVFFSQFLLGLVVSGIFLMSGKLHLPIPALIIAGPIYRGGGLFMLILLASTIMIVGPGWCSHLCYIGAWDFAASQNKKPREINRKKLLFIRYFMIAFTIGLAFLFHVLEVAPYIAFWFALIFGLAGVGSMAFLSRKRGYMVHCTTFCPIGGLVVLAGKIFPFRVRIREKTCTNCLKCSSYCRYDALSQQDIEKGKAGWNCTLCGDCLNSCNKSALKMTAFKFESNLWDIYIALAVSLHTACLACARL